MSVIKNIILVGATGVLGPPILKSLQSNPNFNVSVLTRKESTSSYKPPHGVQILTADYTSHSDLVAAFKGQDAVVSTVGLGGIAGQIELIDAAIEAGVQRFIPSDYGCDTFHEKLASIGFFKPKIDIVKYLERKAAEGKITWTTVLTGPFFDWGLTSGFLGFNIADKKATIYDGGFRPFSTTTIADIGSTVAAILSHPNETKNRGVRVNSAAVKPRDLLAIYEKQTGSKWEVEEKDTAEVEKASNAKIAQGDFSTIYHVLYRCIFGEGYGGEFEDADNELLGIKLLDKAGVEAIVKSTL